MGPILRSWVPEVQAAAPLAPPSRRRAAGAARRRLCGAGPLPGGALRAPPVLSPPPTSPLHRGRPRRDTRGDPYPLLRMSGGPPCEALRATGRYLFFPRNRGDFCARGGRFRAYFFGGSGVAGRRASACRLRRPACARVPSRRASPAAGGGAARDCFELHPSCGLARRGVAGGRPGRGRAWRLARFDLIYRPPRETPRAPAAGSAQPTGSAAAPLLVLRLAAPSCASPPSTSSLRRLPAAQRLCFYRPSPRRLLVLRRLRPAALEIGSPRGANPRSAGAALWWTRALPPRSAAGFAPRLN